MRRTPGPRTWAVASLALVALVVAGALQAGVGRSGDEAAPSLSAPAASRAVDAYGAGATAAVTDKAGESSPPRPATGSQTAPSPPLPPEPGPGAVVPGSPRVVRTAELRVDVGEGGFGAAFDRVASIAAANGGFVSSSSMAAIEEARSGELTVRVPADRFDATRQALGGLGRVDGQAIRGEDVSGQLVDYEARLTSLRSQEEALRVLVGQAKAVGEVLQVQSSLFDVRRQIEQLDAQRGNLEQTASLATIQVSLFEPGATPVPRPDGGRSLAASVDQALDGMLAVVGGMIVVVGWLLPLGTLGLLGWAAARVLRRRPARRPAAV